MKQLTHLHCLCVALLFRTHSPLATVNWRPNAPLSREGRAPTLPSPSRWRELLPSALPSRTAVPGKVAPPWGSTWRLWPRCATIAKAKLPTRSSLQRSSKLPRPERPNLACVPSSSTSVSSSTTPTGNPSFPNEEMRFACQTFSLCHFCLLPDWEGSIKVDRSGILFVILVSFTITCSSTIVYVPHSDTRSENLWKIRDYLSQGPSCPHPGGGTGNDEIMQRKRFWVTIRSYLYLRVNCSTFAMRLLLHRVFLGAGAARRWKCLSGKEVGRAWVGHAPSNPNLGDISRFPATR